MSDSTSSTRVLHDKDKKADVSTPKTEWASLWISGIIQFFCAIQFTIYFSSLWPYLQQLDPSSTESQFGHITAIYSLGQGSSLMVYGIWSKKAQNTSLPVLTGIFMMALGNAVYLLIPIFGIQPYAGMMASRLIMGLGAGIISPLRAYAIQASTKDDRSRAISLNTGGFCLGLLAGPALQILFTPLGYPGVRLFWNFSANIYTGPAIMGILVNLFSAEHERFFALPKYDIIGALICIFSRFVQMFVITNLETIGSPLTMTVFAWTREKAVYYNSMMHIGFGLIGLVYYGANTIWDFSKHLNHRLWTIYGVLLVTLFHLLTYPWWFLPGSIQYQKEYDLVNGTLVKIAEPVGCRPTFDWCATTPPINVFVYVFSYIFLIGLAFPIINVTMTVVYSDVIGPRDQGTMQGIILLAGSMARLMGPLFVASFFESSGMKLPWIIEIAMSLGCAMLWIIYYKRMVPLKHGNELKAGDHYKNKFGKVERF
ncbi:unnamed protein product, partial [Mesorhabditis spiculigera]